MSPNWRQHARERPRGLIRAAGNDCGKADRMAPPDRICWPSLASTIIRVCADWEGIHDRRLSCFFTANGPVKGACRLVG